MRALVHAPVTRPAARRRGRSSRRPSSTRGLAGLASAGEWSSRDAWLDELRAAVASRLAARAREQPARSRAPARRAAPGRAVGGRRAGPARVERRGAKAYLPGRPRRLGARSADAAAQLEARLAEEEIVKVDDRELAAFLESEGRLRRVGDGYAVSADLYDRGAALLPQLDAITLAALPGRARGRAAHGAAAARALRRGRAHAPARRRARSAAKPRARLAAGAAGAGAPAGLQNPSGVVAPRWLGSTPGPLRQLADASASHAWASSTVRTTVVRSAMVGSSCASHIRASP